jgi:hypothetical protein
MKDKSIAFVNLMRANISENFEKGEGTSNLNGYMTTKTSIGVLLVLFLDFGVSVAQRQLVLVSGDKVVYRFTKGDNFKSKLKSEKTEHWGFLVEISEFSIITSQDTIELKKIRKVLLPGRPLPHKIGVTLVKVGVGLFVIDQVNQTLIQHNDFNIDTGIAKTSIALAGAGLPLLLFKKNWKKLEGGMRLMSVGRDSRFYLPESN